MPTASQHGERMMNVESRTAMAPVRKTIEVPRDAATAFRAFAMGSAASGRSRPIRFRRPTIRRRAARSSRSSTGASTRRAGAGARLIGAGVRFYEPGRRLFSWHLNRPIEQATDEVRFTEVAPGRTRVELEHRFWKSWRTAPGCGRCTTRAGIWCSASVSHIRRHGLNKTRSVTPGRSRRRAAPARRWRRSAG